MKKYNYICKAVGILCALQKPLKQEIMQGKLSVFQRISSVVFYT